MLTRKFSRDSCTWENKGSNGEMRTKSIEKVSEWPDMSSEMFNSKRQRSNEETSYAAAAAAGCKGDYVGLTGSGPSVSLTKVNATNKIIPGYSAFPRLPTDAFGTSTAYKKDVGVQANLTVGKGISTSASKECQTQTVRKSAGRSRGTGTTRDKGKDQGIMAKICSCDDRSHPTPVEFYGEHFKFENTLAKSIANLDISFIDFNEESQINYNDGS